MAPAQALMSIVTSHSKIFVNSLDAISVVLAQLGLTNLNVTAQNKSTEVNTEYKIDKDWDSEGDRLVGNSVGKNLADISTSKILVDSSENNSLMASS